MNRLYDTFRAINATALRSLLTVFLLSFVLLSVGAQPSGERVDPEAVGHIKALVARRLNMISLPEGGEALSKLTNPTMDEVKKAIPEKYSLSRQLCDNISKLNTAFDSPEAVKTYYTVTIFNGSVKDIDDFFNKPGRDKADARKKITADIERYLESHPDIMLAVESEAREQPVQAMPEGSAQTTEKVNPEKTESAIGLPRSVEPDNYHPKEGAGMFGVIVFIIIVLLLLAGCAYLWLELQKSKEEIAKLKHENAELRNGSGR